MKILVQIRLLKHFEVFTLPKSFDTPKLTIAEEKILQAQEVVFIEISLDQQSVFEVEENANWTVDDIHYFSAVQVFDPFTSHVEFIRFKEYCGMPRGPWAPLDIYSLSIYVRFSRQFFLKFSQNKMDCNEKKIVVSCLNVITIAFIPEIVQWNTITVSSECPQYCFFLQYLTSPF